MDLGCCTGGFDPCSSTFASLLLPRLVDGGFGAGGGGGRVKSNPIFAKLLFHGANDKLTYLCCTAQKNTEHRLQSQYP